MLKGLSQNLLINRICPIPLMFLQGEVAVNISYCNRILLCGNLGFLGLKFERID